MAKKENETATQGQQSEKLKALKAAICDGVNPIFAIIRKCY